IRSSREAVFDCIVRLRSRGCAHRCGGPSLAHWSQYSQIVRYADNVTHHDRERHREGGTMTEANHGLLEGKAVLVVGASTGIGADAARLFAREGASVMLAARSESLLADIVDELAREGHEADAVTCDVTSASQVDAMVESTIARF